MATAKELIDRLVKSGITKAEIARRVGRDSSLISQIEKGKKPGSNLVEPLRAIVEKRAVPKPVARLTKAGKPAKVRRGKGASKPELRRDSNGRIKIAPPTKLEHVAVRRLTEIANAGGKVSIRLVFAGSRESVLFERGGEYASRLLAQYLKSGQGFFDWLAERRFEVVEARYGVDAEKIDLTEPPQAVGFLAIYTAAEARL